MAKELTKAELEALEEMEKWTAEMRKAEPAETPKRLADAMRSGEPPVPKPAPDEEAK